MKPYLGICLVLITMTGIAWFALRSCTAAVDHTVDHVRDAFAEALHVQPQVTVNQRVVLAQTAPIAEFAVVRKDELVTLGFNEHLEVLSVEVPLTEKTLTAEAVYRLKAGFDLSEPFSVVVDPVTRALHATLPRARILSVERIGDISYQGEDAWLNRITDEERTQILNSLDQTAHDAGEKSGLKAEAEQQVAQRLNELMIHNGETLQIEWNKEAPGSRQSPGTE